MKKIKKNKTKVPACAFGINRIGNAMGDYAGIADVAGGITSAFGDAGSGADIAGGAISGAAKGAGIGMAAGPIGAVAGGVLGLAGGLFTGFKRKKALEEQKRRKETAQQTAYGLNNAAAAEAEYWDDNTLAYTYANGGIMPNDLAYLDNNEVIRDDFGNIDQVPNNKRGTDNHLVDASSLESVLSDKIKRPGTNKTFAQEGEKLTKMTKPSKGRDRFAEAANKLNMMNANRKYDQLLAEQEEVKAKKGIKPKVKDVPAFEDGGWKKGYLERLYLNNARKYLLPNGGTYKAQKEAGYNRNYGTGSINLDYNVPIQYDGATSNYAITPSFSPADTPEVYSSVSDPTLQPIQLQEQPSTKKRSVTKSSNAVVSKPTIKPFNRVDTPEINVWDFDEAPMVDIEVSDPELKSIPTPSISKARTSKGNTISSINSSLLDLAPTIYNTIQGIRGPETESNVTNPYASTVNRTMARRRMNINPSIEANRRSRAIANYNASNINANTGSNLAFRTQAATLEYTNNADMYATKQNADNAYLGEYANTLNNLGQQWVQGQVLTNDLNAKNRAASRNYTGTAMSQLGQWSQVRRQEANQYNKDQMVLPFLADFLSQGYTSDMVNSLYSKTKKNK